MSNFLQDIMGMLWKKQRVSPKEDDVIGIGRYLSKEEKVKPKPQITTKVITLEDLKTFVSTEGLVTIKPYNLIAGAGGSSRPRCPRKRPCSRSGRGSCCRRRSSPHRPRRSGPPCCGRSRPRGHGTGR